MKKVTPPKIDRGTLGKTYYDRHMRNFVQLDHFVFSDRLEDWIVSPVYSKLEISRKSVNKF